MTPDPPQAGGTAPSDPLARARGAWERRAWADAYEALTRADAEVGLDADGLERLAGAAYLTGRDDEFVAGLERAHQAHDAAGDPVRAARCAFWVALKLLLSGAAGAASGWLARARRLVDDRDCVEQGYLLVPVAEELFHAGEADAAYAKASDAAGYGDRFDDPDLAAAARHLQGRVRIRQGHMREGLALLDDAMVTVTSGAMSPIMAGLIYCSVIEACQHAHAVARAREWTETLTRWCDDQPQLVAFTGTCLVHRAEILTLHGNWPDAMAEAQRACARPGAPAAAHYQQAEVHRLRGEYGAAEAAYREASRAGYEPQPGLALLRLAQGRTDAATGALRRVLDATPDPLRRTRLLPACVEIMLAAGEPETAQAAADELHDIAGRYESDALDTLAAEARGTVALARGDDRTALTALQEAWHGWQALEAPYLAARVRVRVGEACRRLGDHDGAQLEWDGARAVFDELGAAPDLEHLRHLTRPAASEHRHGLTPRELQVLRIVAAGSTNRDVAHELGISEKTVARHVSNIFNKLGLTSRTAATAYAYEHGLV